MSTSSGKMRVYNRRSKMGSRPLQAGDKEADTRDWAGLPPKLLEKVFENLQVSDLQSAKETCRKWRAQVGGEPLAMSSWTDTIDSILEHLHQLNHEADADVEMMTAFLVREGIMKAP